MPALTALSTVAEFLDVLERSQLLKPVHVARVREQSTSICDSEPTPELLAKSLIKSQIVTLYQAQRLLAGMAEGFYLGKYKIMELLGRGGMGKVYLAEQITMNRLVAIKVISKFAKNRDDTLARFAREAKAVAALQHANIIQAFDFDQIDGLPYIVMEYVEGVDLGELVTKTGRIDWASAADIGYQAALGLEAARAAGIVHRDVKPGNLLVDRNGVVKILDLGLAVSRDEQHNGSLTSADDQIGTVDFMSPEQAIDSHNVDCRADIYSLGGVLYFSITGRLPCPGKNSATKLMAHQQMPPKPIQDFVPEIPNDLALIIHGMLAKKQNERPQTPSAVAELLKPFAKRRSPPFDLQLLKHSRESLAPLLGRSPDLETINIGGQLAGETSQARSNDGSSASRIPGGSGNSDASQSSSRRSGQSGAGSTSIAAKTSGSTIAEMPIAKPKPEVIPELAKMECPAAPTNTLDLRQPSEVTCKPVPTVIDSTPEKLTKTQIKKKPQQSKIVVTPDAPTVSDDDYLNTLAEAPLMRSMKKRSKKKKRFGSLPWPLLIGVATVAMLLVGFLWWSSQKSTSDLSASATVPRDLPPSFDNWQAWSNQFKQDADLVFYFTFSGDTDVGDVVRSQATNPKYSQVNAKIYGAKYSFGRFAQKKGLRFGGNVSKNYVALGDSDSNLCNFTTSFSVGAWFKAESPKSNFQCVIGKGDNSWRLHRHQNSEKLELGTNAQSQDPVTKQVKSKLTFNTSLASIDDQKWHFAVATYDLSGKTGVQHLYLDGRVEGVAEFDSLNKNDFPVYIGANSQTFKADPRAWSGLIDEVFVINRALTATEITRMHVAGRSAQ